MTVLCQNVAFSVRVQVLNIMADAPVNKEEQTPVNAAVASVPPPDVASDPDEDDLSDLDGMSTRPLSLSYI